MTNIHRKDYPSLKEYNRARMKFYNLIKHMDQRRERYKDLISIIREIEKESSDEDYIVDKLANSCKYKLVIDKDLTSSS